MKKTGVFIFLLLFIILGGISVLYYYAQKPSDSDTIKISTNPWVGFTPFVYAQEKGWLDATPFRFMWIVDLSDNTRLYERGFTQGFTATQYELLNFKNANSISPIFLIDRSYGADAIVANRSLEEIRNESKKIDVYLEQGSLNDDFFETFIAEHHLSKEKFRKVDTSQKSILMLNVKGEAPIIVISYQPYLSSLLKKGFQPLASTRTMETFFVVDALFVDEKAIQGREKEFEKLREIFALGLKQLRNDPEEYYETIKGYLEGQTSEEFMSTTTQLEWLNEKNSEAIILYLNNQKIKTDRLLP